MYVDKKYSSEEYLNWLKNLNTGDEVAYERGTGYYRHRTVSKVKNRTPSGRIRLEDGTQWYHYGKGQGDCSWRYIEPYTEEMKAEKARKNAVQFLSKFDFETLNPEDLLKVMEVIRSGKGRV